MSHFSEVKTRIRDSGRLKKALRNLGYALEENEQGVEVRGFFGNATKAEFKALTDSTYDIGFVKNEAGDYEITADWELMPRVAGIEQEDFMRRVKREYAQVSIREIAAERGLEVATVEQNGQIEMTVTQW